MNRLTLMIVAAMIAIAAARAHADGKFDGEWRTTIATVTLKQEGDQVTGSYGNGGENTIKGKAAGNTLKFEFHEAQASGTGEWNLDDSGNAFTGKFTAPKGKSGQWNGWRPDPDATHGDPVKIEGPWLTNLGLMELQRAEDKIKGRYALQGISRITGTVTGRRFDFTYKSFYPGKGWLDVAVDGATFTGAASSDGFAAWYGWRGRRAPEFVRHPKLTAGKIVDGSTRNLLTYSARAPEDYHAGDKKKWPTIVILHGSNMNGKAYVATIASAWPDIAKDYLLIGINGETASDLGDDPRFNYTYVDYVGRSTFKGFPGTDRESPALVAEALDDLQKAYPIDKYFVGGHSQGGFLTYSLLMNFPEKLAGAFPISAGVIFQCEPKAFTDDKLKAAQRAVPLAIVHGKNDPNVKFAMGEYAAKIFREANWPAMQFFADNSGAGHRFALLPVNKAIRWLEKQSPATQPAPTTGKTAK